jgi:phosphopentomutase
MKDSKRVFLIVLDSVGAGAAPDAESFGDAGVNTLRSVYETGILNIPNLKKLGIGNIDGLSFLGKSDAPIASVARLRELSGGKDTTIGHWEIAGHVSEKPMPTFPDGFPSEIIDKLSEAFGRGILCNKPYSGTAVINDFGEEHLKTGDLIVYTSADSVLQIAAHKDIVSLDELYGYCRKAREIMQGEAYGVGRIIARPFVGEAGDFRRSADRRDFSLEPPADLLPEKLVKSGYDCISVGKISDIFAGRKFTEEHYTHSNEEGMAVCSEMAKKGFYGLCFVNLVDFDMLWGHRRDAVAYANGLNAFDSWLGGFADSLGEDDMLIITADHGCDPSFKKTTDHTREYTPLLVYKKGEKHVNMGTLDGFSTISDIVLDTLGVNKK